MKKTVRIILSVVMAAVFCLSSVPFAFAGTPAENNLQFGSDGKFTIIQFADTQDGYPFRDALKAFMNEVLDKVQPDLVIFTGDNVVCDDLRAYDELLTPLTERGIPFTFTFGNHDDECAPSYTKEQLLETYQTYAGCLAYDADPALSGCATHNLTIKSSDGTKTAFNLWLLDSGDYMTDSNGEKCYSCVRADQVEWYKSVSAQLEADNGGLVPSLAFQHIIPQEGYEKAFFGVPLKLGKITKNFEDGYVGGYLTNISAYDGYVLEPSCPSLYNFGEWDAFKERGDVLGCAIGHDHVNSFIMDVDGIDIIQTPGCTWNSYGNNINRGCGVFTLDENDPWSYDYELLTVSEMACESGSQIPGLEDTIHTYRFNVILLKMLDFFDMLLKSFGLPV